MNDVRMPIPAKAFHKNPYENRYTGDEIWPWVGPAMDTVFIGGAAVLAALLFGIPLLFLVLVLPAYHLVHYARAMKNSVLVLEEGRGGDRGLYAQAVKAYRELYDAEHRAEALPLLEKVYEHEMALTAIDKPHRSGNYDSSDCNPCMKRIKLIRDVAKYQPVPETTTYDIDHIEASLAVKKEMLAITAGSQS